MVFYTNFNCKQNDKYLKRTTIIPVDDTALAGAIFSEFIEKEKMILMIIIGDTKSILDAIPKAYNLA